MAVLRSRHKSRSYLVWVIGITACALILIKIAFSQGSSNSAVAAFFQRDEESQFERLYPARKPTLCPPVKDGDLDPAPPGVKYGRPVRQSKHVMYTSVPKCGSRSLIWVMWNINGALNSSDIKDFDYRLDDSTVEKERDFLDNLLNSASRPTFFHGHQRFIDYEGDDGPVYISILREPISRFVSWYYFMRHGDADMNNATELQVQLGQNSTVLNETIDDCFHNKRESCVIDYYMAMNVMVFCGYDKRCTRDRGFALSEAKKNLDKYMVVGIMEQYEDTIRVLEKLMPSLFGGGAVMYKKIKAESASISKTKFKIAPSQETLEIMKANMKEDIDFYEYAKQRFHDLKLSLKIGTTRNC